jgi:CheY-like chemotaxis protein
MDTIVNALKVLRRQPGGGDKVLLRFEVRDTGIGISKEVQGRLFQSFTQADNSTTRRYGGTGLGLAICKQLVEMMGGILGVASAPGAGSTFWFNIPFGATQDPPPASAPVENLRGRRVLAVDDNGTNRSILKQQLGAIGMMVTCAPSGAEALEELSLAARQDRPYELAILDLHMPLMNGLTLAKHIRANREIGCLPLMMLTSDRDRDEASAARELDVKIFLVKPVRQANLVRAVGEMFGSVPGAFRPQAEETRQLAGRVLVVEDNPTNQKVIVLRLEKMGCRADIATNGQEAVEASAQVPYDVILMDCQMPVMDGFEATARIRARGGFHVPIIALTANAMEDDREHCLQAGMDDYLSKPVRNKELADKLSRWIGTPPLTDGPAGTGETLRRFLTSLEEEGFRREEIDVLLGSFLDSSARIMVDLESAAGTRDAARLRMATHTLKGSAATLGLTSLAALAAEMERQEKAADWEGISRSLASAREQYASARETVASAIGVPAS